MLRLPSALQVAFITGRSEGGRDATIHNLEQEGYGSQCPRDANGKRLRTKDEPCWIELHMRDLKGAPPHEPDRSFDALIGLASKYKPQCSSGHPAHNLLAHDVKAFSRAGDQHTPASVYKPARRAQLQAQGYRLIGMFGDQFSDSEGANPALAAWKLPNPLYYIL
jgi:HAD superfamily, subfamily IIIB (Acid phosphatase)